MITFSEISLQLGTQVLLDQTSATVHGQQKVGLVGRNGCGKSTLLALLKNELQLDKGDLSLPKQWRISHVKQETPALERTALDYVLDGDSIYRQLQQQLVAAESANDGTLIADLHHKLDAHGAYTIEARAGQLLNGLGFSTQQQKASVADFSGGWRMRLNLAQALICPSDLLLLDEPTNHLDLDAVIWLGKFLNSYPGTLLLISHDREFLDEVCDNIIHIEQQKLNLYKGNYSSFEKQRIVKLEQQQALHEKQMREKAHIQSFIDRFKAKASKAKQAQSRVKALAKMEIIGPAHVDSEFHFEFKPADKLPNPLIALDQVAVGYSQTPILDTIKLNLVPGSRIGLLGRNGAGKSTLVKLLAGELTPLTGEQTISSGLNIGYFAQHQLEQLHSEDTPLSALTRLAPNELEQKLRDYLGGFGFSGDQALDKVEKFSGGEKARLVLALLVWQKPNLLLLDEPTNHLDLDMRLALTMALQNFDGAMIIVSHDRHILSSTCDDFYLVDSGQVLPFDGDLKDYENWLVEQARQVKAEQNAQTSSSDNKTENSAQARKEAKRKEAEIRKQTQPLRKQIDKLEKSVDKLQAKLDEIENQLADNDLYSDQRKAELNTLLEQQVTVKQQLADDEEAWMMAEEELETLLESLQ
ncbi:ABC transporter ATP-binding protein [Catenovulum sp. SM1970]|uniref:ABC transporter ATP-binding protein n=1 Tax=Marinifaba aquimaris TaxID=2741323 RepID=UPI001572A7C4|nr:ABC transporter ATP-binding protein [Marinifaba aquimaris]NTS75686.1 ABC transporter ATP-binding protein [Marinifaba aquimaris]